MTEWQFTDWNGCEQALCLLSVRYGAPPQLWAEYLPTWLLDPGFVARLTDARKHGEAHQPWQGAAYVRDQIAIEDGEPPAKLRLLGETLVCV